MTVADALDYLANLGVTLWPAVAFDITDEKERVLAAHWLSNTVWAVDEQR